MSTFNADLDTLRAWVGAVSNEANTLLRVCLDTATDEIRDMVMADHFDKPGVQLRIIMYAARLFKRRQSPEGVAGWGDLGVVRIQSSDPDIYRGLEPHLDMCKAGVA